MLLLCSLFLHQLARITMHMAVALLQSCCHHRTDYILTLGKFVMNTTKYVTFHQLLLLRGRRQGQWPGFVVQKQPHP